MPDLLIHNIDEAMGERIRQIAAQRNWTTDQVVLHALRYALGFVGESLVLRERRDIARLRGTWNSDETAMFDAALTAFEHLEGVPLFEQSDGSVPNKPGAKKRT